MNSAEDVLDTAPAPNGKPAAAIDRTMMVAGVAQLLSVVAPAADLRFARNLNFLGLPTAGVALVVLGVLTLLVALRPRGPWRWVPGILSALVLAVAYWRLQWAPTTSFADPLLRGAVGPGWGFIPMGASVLLSIIGAARARW
ncbi:MAG: hypothetical protein V4617_03805 [Gemmatimonadota bacterium]